MNALRLRFMTTKALKRLKPKSSNLLRYKQFAKRVYRLYNPTLMIIEGAILKEIDQVAFDAWYGPDDTGLVTADRISQGTLMVTNIKGIIKKRFAEDLTSCPAFHFNQIISGLYCDISYTSGGVDRLRVELDKEKLEIELLHDINGISDAHVTYVSGSEMPKDNARSLRMGHSMIDLFENLLLR